MLNMISCEKLIESPINFKEGLNVVLGANDAHNSIGKSSILMLIDFVFGGSDFPIKCDDVIRNVGHLKIGFEFEFDKKYTFIRDTEQPDQVYNVVTQEFIDLKKYTDFLKSQYLSDKAEISFRECVSAFFRIYQRSNFDEHRPLDVIKRDKWDAIRKRILKLFNVYWVISELEKKRALKNSEITNIKGTYKSGAIQKVGTREYKRNEILIDKNDSDIQNLKNTLSENVTDIQSVINKKSLKLISLKDSLVENIQDLEVQLQRLGKNLSGNTPRSSKSFKVVKEFFPEIDLNRLEEVEGFHSGISKIMSNQLKEEKAFVIDSLDIARAELNIIDEDLLKIVDSDESVKILLEELMDLDRNQKNIIQQNGFYKKKDAAEKKLKEINSDIKLKISESINDIENRINLGLEKFIEMIYTDKPIFPKIFFSETDYNFDHGDDRGTGKGYANLIAMDLALLEETDLPCIIHDSLLFKNMDVPAIQQLFSIYNTFDKQIFVSIDEVHKYDDSTKEIFSNSKILELNKSRLAFNKKWKRRDDTN